MMPPRIAIIGGGFTGAVVAIQLTRLLRGAAVIDIVEPRPMLGCGVAYSATDSTHRINVPAARMTVFAEDPTHFDRWLRRVGALADDPAAVWVDGSAYPQRHVFGRYVAALLAEARAARPDISVRHHQTRASAIDAGSAGFTVGLEQGAPLRVEAVVLAVSHPPPAAPAALRGLAAAGGRVVADPWQPGAMHAVGADDLVLVAGTGLSMADVVACLAARGHRGSILAVSRRGLLSRGHAARPAAKRCVFETAPPPATARALLRAVRAQVARAAAEDAPWQAVLDDVRASGYRLWSVLPIAEKRRVLRHLRPYWDVHRFRVAPQVEAAMTHLARRGQFSAMAASFETAALEEGRMVVQLRPRGAARPVRVQADAVVITTGPAHGNVLRGNTALASLAAQGLLRGDDVGLGLAVDGSSRAVDADGAARPDLFVAGPLARGRFGELMGLPQVSEHAASVAASVAALLAGNARGTAMRAAGNDAAAPARAVFPPVFTT